MKTLNLHATQTKKTYRKPALKTIGKVKNLTLKGGSNVDGQGGNDLIPA